MLADWVRTTMQVAGFITCLGGTFPIWKDRVAAVFFSLAIPKDTFLGEVRLNLNSEIETADSADFADFEGVIGESVLRLTFGKRDIHFFCDI